MKSSHSLMGTALTGEKFLLQKQAQQVAKAALLIEECIVLDEVELLYPPDGETWQNAAPEEIRGAIIALAHPIVHATSFPVTDRSGDMSIAAMTNRRTGCNVVRRRKA